MTNSEIETEIPMAYKLTWYMPHKVLSLILSGEYTVEDAIEVNRLIIEELNQSQTPLIIFIDAMAMKRSYNFGDIRTVQTFMDHRNLKHIFVASGDRLVKLAMMVVFNLARAHLMIFDDTARAEQMLKRQADNPR